MAEESDLEALKASLSPAARDRFRDLLEVLAGELSRRAKCRKTLDRINADKKLTDREKGAERRRVAELAQYFVNTYTTRRGLVKWLRARTALPERRLREHLRQEKSGAR